MSFEGVELNTKQFMKEVARHEKHLMVSFVNLLYSQISDFKEDPEGDINKKI
jgi:hypothetical protein